MNKRLKIILIVTVVTFIVIIAWQKYPFSETKNAITSRSPSTSDIAAIKIPNFFSSASMNFSYYGIDMNPKELNQRLRESEGYTSRGWLIWSKLLPLSDEKLVVSFPELSHENIDGYLLAKKPVLVKVFINRIIPHWVLVVGKRGKEYLMLDPLRDGALTEVSSYGSYIYSMRVYGHLIIYG